MSLKRPPFNFFPKSTTICDISLTVIILTNNTQTVSSVDDSKLVKKQRINKKLLDTNGLLIIALTRRYTRVRVVMGVHYDKTSRQPSTRETQVDPVHGR